MTYRWKDIDTEIQVVLTDPQISTWDMSGELTTLKMTPLDRKMYTRVAKVLKALGGQWKHKEQWTEFSTDPRPTIEAGAYTVDKDFFQTPVDLARELVTCARLEGDEVVWEPSAGSGAIAGEIRMMRPTCSLYVNDINSEWFSKLVMSDRGWNMIGPESLDFLSISPAVRQPPDVIIQNPPWSNYQAFYHVKHAFKLARRCSVTLLSDHYWESTHPTAVKFRAWLEQHMSDRHVYRRKVGLWRFVGQNTAGYTEQQVSILRLTKLKEVEGGKDAQVSNTRRGRGAVGEVLKPAFASDRESVVDVGSAQIGSGGVGGEGTGRHPRRGVVEEDAPNPGDGDGGGPSGDASPVQQAIGKTVPQADQLSPQVIIGHPIAEVNKILDTTHDILKICECLYLELQGKSRVSLIKDLEARIKRECKEQGQGSYHEASRRLWVSRLLAEVRVWRLTCDTCRYLERAHIIKVAVEPCTPKVEREVPWCKAANRATQKERPGCPVWRL